MRTYTADEVDAMIGRALARERERVAQQQMPDDWFKGMPEEYRRAAWRIKEQPAPATELREQEPVAAQSVMTVRIWRDKNSDQNAEFKNWHKLPDGEHILYTYPPPQRTWVGLTDGEIVDLCDGRLTTWGQVSTARAIEAKLKEKNT